MLCQFFFKGHRNFRFIFPSLLRSLGMISTCIFIFMVVQSNVNQRLPIYKTACNLLAETVLGRNMTD